MTARVLVVDDVDLNVKLLEVKLKQEYFEVMGATSGAEALKIALERPPDIVLLDVMMPDMDGFETCRRMRAEPALAHIPVVMVTALDKPQDRVKGLESGADDFLSKPVDDTALIARVRSLVRLKVMEDELRLREETASVLGDEAAASRLIADDGKEANILVVDGEGERRDLITEALEGHNTVAVESEGDRALDRIGQESFDLVVLGLALPDYDGLKLCAQVRSVEATRHQPILVVIAPDEKPKLLQALDMGVNDYLVEPLEGNEVRARARTQIRRKRYTDALRANYQKSVELAVTDDLTGLYNRRYLESHLDALLVKAKERGKPLSLTMVDIDHFKAVNDDHGHDAGDAVLAEFAERLQRGVRGVDLACRYGGEEFVILMPDTGDAFAALVAERVRQEVAEEAFRIGGEAELNITASFGVASLAREAETGAQLLKRADKALYQAKEQGRNRVIAAN